MNKKLLIPLFSMLFTIIFIKNVNAAIVTLSTNDILDDAHVSGFVPTNNYGSTEDLQVYWDANAFRSYIKFNISSFYQFDIDDITIIQLCLYELATAGGGYQNLEVRNSTSLTWKENTITWNNQPNTSSVVISNTIGGGTALRYYCADVTTGVKTYLNNGYQNGTFLIQRTLGSGTAGGASFNSSEAVGGHAILNASIGNCTKTDGSSVGNPDVLTKGTCYDSFGTYQDSCYSSIMVYEYECGFSSPDFCNLVLEGCPSGTTCSNGACLTANLLNLSTNKDNCAVYSPSIGGAYYIPNTNASITYYPISDCQFQFWYISPNNTQINTTSFILNMAQNYSVTAVWVLGQIANVSQPSEIGGGTTITGSEWLNPFLSGYFILGMFNLAIGGLATFWTKNIKFGVGVFFLIFLVFLFGGFYPNVLFIPIIAIVSIIIGMYILKMHQGD